MSTECPTKDTRKKEDSSPEGEKPVPKPRVKSLEVVTGNAEKGE